MDLIRKIPKKFTKKFGNKVINRKYFCRKTGLKLFIKNHVYLLLLSCLSTHEWIKRAAAVTLHYTLGFDSFWSRILIA